MIEESSPDEPPDESEESADSSLVGKTLGPYRLESVLGTGGMGAVYRAYDRRLDRRVALKQILPDVGLERHQRQRFVREARAVARLNHPAVVQIFDLLETEGSDWIVMELAEGETLADLLTEGPLALEEGLPLALELAEGLAAAHDEDIVHRDLKPRNVIVTRKGRAKILDFGLAKILAPSPAESQRLDGSSEDVSLTGAGRVIGTPQAMSPEQAMGLETDHRSDLFSLGSLLYQLFTGVAPFGTKTTVATLARVCTHHQAPAHEVESSIPRPLSQLIGQLLEKAPEDRPSTAHHVAGELWDLVLELGLRDATKHRAGLYRRVEEAGPSRTLSLDEQPVSPEVSSPSPRGHSSSEIRQVTVMSCELVSAGAGAGSLEPEALFEAMEDYQALARRVVERFEGHLVSTLGHRLVITFGYPHAHDDDAARAVRAALDLRAAVEAMTTSATAWPVEGLTLRIGLHTGSAVVSAGVSEDGQLVLGKTLDLASGIRSQVAEPGIWTSPLTHALVEDLIEAEAPQGLTLPGLAEALEIRRVSEIHERPVDSRRSGARTMIGRDNELELLLDRWQRARDGDGQVALVSGEAGIGKSRLMLGLRRHIEQQGARCLLGHGSSYARFSPLRPVGEILRQALGLRSEESSADPLEQRLVALSLAPERLIPLLAPLLALSLDGRYDTPPLSPNKLRAERMTAVLAVLEALAEQGPLTLIVEDLHWLDPSSLELIGRLLDRVGSLPLLIVLTTRPGFEAPWGYRSGINQLNLERLVESEVRSLIAELVGERELPAEVRDRIVARTDGVPLFVEELTRTLLASERAEDEGEDAWVTGGPTGGPSPWRIPATLRESLTARLDQMGNAKTVAQLASVIGRELSHALLAALPSCRDIELEPALERLVEGELFRRRGLGEKTRFVFKHALVQDAAYESLLGKQRRRIHGEVADALAEKFSRVVAKHPELLARHLTEAGRLGPAIDSWKAAGQQAFRHSALVEAQDHLERGLELVARLPAGQVRDRRHLELLAILGPAASASQGFASPGVGKIYRRAVELLDRLGVERTVLEDLSAIGIAGSGPGEPEGESRQRMIEDPELFWISWGLWSFYLMRGDLAEATELARRLYGYARRQQDSAVRMEALYARGFTRWARGKLVEARRAFERGLALEDEARDPARLLVTGRDVGVITRSILGLVLWQLGYPDQARASCRSAIELGRRIDHPFSLTTALTIAADVHLLCGDRVALGEEASEVVELSESLGFGHAAAQGRGLLGWARAGEEDDAEQGLGALRLALDQSRAAGARFSESLALSFLAAGWLRHGRIDEVRQATEEAMATVRTTGECFWEAEILRLQGEVAQHEGDLVAAEDTFGRALELAREQGARSLELRAAISLARLRRQGTGGPSGARRRLEALLAEFDEGLDTADLVEAREVLASLSRE